MSIVELIVFVVILTAILIYSILNLYSKIKLIGFKNLIIKLIVEAEETIEKGKNNEKFSKVLNGVIDSLPPIMKMFITEDILIAYIQKIFESIKVALDAKSLEPKETIEEEIKRVEKELEESEG